MLEFPPWVFFLFSLVPTLELNTNCQVQTKISSTRDFTSICITQGSHTGEVLSQLATGCVTCHTSHGCVTHFRPILGNLVEVTLVTSPFMYIVSHTKGTSFP